MHSKGLTGARINTADLKILSLGGSQCMLYIYICIIIIYQTNSISAHLILCLHGAYIIIDFSFFLHTHLDRTAFTDGHVPVCDCEL